ncbi:energy transducer TonB [Sphingomonas sp.]|uniref:energy transducer TonB n=1 Tax=Sphingomonas sp. TaxID=28214 RepID=UPI0031D1BF02
MNALLLLTAVSAQASSSASPQPQRWTVDYGETSCTASRQLGSADKPILLAFRPSVPGSTIRIMVLREAPWRPTRHLPLQVSGVPATGLRFAATDRAKQLLWINLDRAKFDRATSGPTLRLTGEGIDLDLPLQGVAAAVKAMDMCNADLRGYWNADEAGRASIETRPKPLKPIERLISHEDYPDQAMSEGKGGTTQVALLIDEKDTLRDCLVETHSGVASIDAQTCTIIMQRGKFASARDKAGKPVKSLVSLRFGWRVE